MYPPPHGYGPPPQQGYYGPQAGYMPHAPPGYGYAQPWGWEPPMVQGGVLDVPVHGASFPALCCKCGTTNGLRPRFQQFTWVNPLAYLGVLAGLLPMMIIVMVMQKKTSASLPICEPCDKRWRNANIIRGLSIAAPFILPFLLGFGVGAIDPDTGAMVGLLSFFVFIIALPVAATFIVQRPASIFPTFIDDRRAKLKGACPEFLDAVQRSVVR
jgi:hypothetical protein